MEDIISLAKRRGFIYQGSEIYEGITGFWDYGPLGVELKNNLKREWWNYMVYSRENVVGVDAAIIMNPQVWEASGHVRAFNDPLVECKNCHSRFRVDHLTNDQNSLKAIQKKWSIYLDEIIDVVQKEIKKGETHLKEISVLDKIKVEKKNPEEIKSLEEIIKKILDLAQENISKAKEGINFGEFIHNQIRDSYYYYGIVVQNYLSLYEKCSVCNSKKWTVPRRFNLMTEVFLGVTEPKQKAYLRGEITQGVFVNFKNVVDSTRIKIPFGIAQIGKAFRNEITPGNFTYRSREFEQMELEFFIKPEDAEGEKWFEFWKKERMGWYRNLGIKKENLRFRDHEEHEKAHYARRATDIEYNAPFGWSEFEGVHHRGDFDLKNHHLTYRDNEAGEEYTPWVIETSGGVDRAMLFFLIDAYQKEKDRIVLKLHPRLAPVKVAVFPLVRNKEEITKKAKGIYSDLKKNFVTHWDDRGNIGKRYFAQDEIGTPFCITVDYQTLEDKTVTVRDRDTTAQQRVAVDELVDYVKKKLEI